MRSNPDPSKVARGYTKMTIAEAVGAYADERRPSVKPRTSREWIVSSRPLIAHFKDLQLKRFTTASICAYQSHRQAQGIAPKTSNNEVCSSQAAFEESKAVASLPG